jgi:2-isopropylmalate synthase
MRLRLACFRASAARSISASTVRPRAAIVGRNAFAHEAGIHQHGMLSNPLCYEIITPESVGVPTSDIVLGKHSGRHALISRFEALGHTFEPTEVDDVYARFMELSHKKKNIYDQDLLAIAAARTTTAIAA